jgi:alkanesulfonate monooxygenase SsuD/methylene tetrahydromethanopterin reductase-like flavin-dependent oxidoreductase (luciferase family)
MESLVERASADADELLPVPKFGFSLSFEARHDVGETSEQAYREGLEFAAEADRLGIDIILCPEHHGEESGYVPSPIVAAAAVAAATRNCRIGTGIALAPLYGHPLRMAEDLTVLDNLSGGRLEIGLGQGYRPSEFEAYGWRYQTRTRAFEEAIHILEQAWTGESFDFTGDIYSVHQGRLRPKPLQSRLPLWLGATAPPARARVIRHRAGLMLNALAELEPTARQIASFDRQANEAGVGPLPKMLSREVLIGESAQDAMKRYDEFLNYLYRVQYSPERTGMTYVDADTGERLPLTADHPYYLSEPFMHERWFVGSPDEIAERIVAWQPRLKLDTLLFHARLPGMSLKRGVEEVELFLTEVAPRIRTRIAAHNDRVKAH